MKVTKNKKRFLSYISVFLAALFIGSMSFSGCEIGLGSAVDTQPPSITIETPKVDKVIRDKFAMSGRWSDDGTIAGISVTLKRTDVRLSDYPDRTFTASFEADLLDKGKGTWSVIIDPLEENKTIIDGSYQAIVTISDKGNHSTTQSTTFTIDNTPPIIVLTRPSTSELADSPDTYGQTFNLEGQAADTNDVSLIEVNIYKNQDCSPESYVHTVPLKNVPNSINLDVAKFIKGDEDNDYFKIYGYSDTSHDEETFYCKLVAYDGAERFPIDGSEQTEEDKKGNAVDYYYLYKDIATEILQNYKITEVYSINNGTYEETSAARSVSTDDVLTILQNKKTTKGKFALNPKNNPTFSVAGRSPLLLDKKDFLNGKNDVSSGGQLVIEVSPGLDGILLNKESLKVYAQKYNNNTNTLDSHKIYPTTTIQESGTSYRFATTILKSEGFEIGADYILGVEGYDYSNPPNTIEPAGKAYGFHLASSGNAPKLEVTVPASGEDVYIKEGQSQAFNGEIRVEAGAPVLKIYKGNNSEPIYTKVYTLDDAQAYGASILYTFNQQISDFGTSSGKNIFKFVATLDGVDSPTVEREVIYDKDFPVIKITEPALAKKYDDDGNEDTDKKYLNQTAVFEATIKDKGGSNLASAKYEILVNNTVVMDGNIDLDNEISIPVDTTDSRIDGKTFVFRIIAEDNAGNITKTDDVPDNIINGKYKYEYKADQSTDEPLLVKYLVTTDEFSQGKRNLDFELKTIGSYNAGPRQNKVGTVTKGDYMKFHYYDDDGIVQITIKNKPTNSEDPLYECSPNVDSLTEVYNKSKDTKTITLFDDYQFPNTDDECGYYEYAIIVSDGTKTTTIGPFIVNVAKERASIKVEGTPDWAKDGNDFHTKTYITPSFSPYSAFRQIGNNGTVENLPIGILGDQYYEFSSSTFNDTVNASDLPEEETQVNYYITDGNGQASNVYTITLKKDNTPPEELSITAPATGKTGTLAISDDEYSFGGKVKDNQSGSKYIYYYFGSAAPSGISAYTKMEAPNGNYIINKTIDDGTSATTAGNLYEGSWYLYIRAEDVAGNISDAKSRQFDIDKSAPELTVNGDDDLGYKNGTFTLSGTITETNGLAATDGLVITDANSTYTKTVTPTAGSAGNYTWEQEVTLSTDGKHTLSITAKDKAGKTTTVKRIVTIDTIKPEVSSTMTLPNGQSFDGATISLSGTATDATPSSGLLKVDYFFTDGPDSTANKSIIFTAEGQAYWSASIAKEDLTKSYMNNVFTTQGTKYITVQAYDNAGNLSEPVTKSFVYDTANPTLNNVKIKYTGENTQTTLGTDTVYTKKNGFTISGSFNDSGSNVTIGATRNGTPVTITQDQNTKSGSWSFTETSLADNSYSYIITATDASGRSSTVNAFIVVDITKPVVVITESADVYKNSGAHQFSGTITESNLDTVTAFLYKDTVTTPVKEETIYPVNGNWNWTVTGLEDAKYTLKINATDKATNEENKTSTKKLIIDTQKPVIAVTANNLKDDDGNDVTNTLASNGIYYSNTGYTLSGTINEENFEKATIKTDAADAENLTVSNGAWTKNVSGNGTHTYTITATDKAKNSQSISFTITIDNAKPENVTITAPATGKTGTNAISDNTYIFKGTAYDNTDGTGVVKLWYKFVDATASGASTPPADGYTAIETSEGSWTITKTIDTGTTATGDNLCEGKYYLYVKAQDKAGNTTTTPVSIRFDVDKSAPVISTKLNDTELTLATEQKVKDNYTFKFTVTETNDLTVDSITVKKNETALTLGSGYTIKNAGTNATVSNLSGIVSGTEYKIDIPSQAGDKYTYIISVSDAVGNTASVTRVVRLDKAEPVISVTSPNFTNWQNTNSFSVIGTAADDSGTSAVYYSLNSQKTIPTANVLTQSSWTGNGWSRANGSDSWNISLSNVPDGENNKLYLAAVDTLGNVSSTSTTVTMKIDASIPVLENFFYKLGNGAIEQAGNTVYISTTGSPTLTVYGSYSDGDSGIVELITTPAATIKYSTTSISNAASVAAINNWGNFSATNAKGYKSWKAEYTPTTGGSFAIKGTNNAGLENQKNAFTLVVDNTKPSVNAAFYIKDNNVLNQAFLKNGEYYINPDGKQFTVSGNTTDNYLLEKAVLELQEKASGGQSITKTVTFDSAVGEFEFEKFSLENWSTVYSAKLSVYDKAGNEKEVTLNINFDKTGPVGLHQLDDMTKDLYFRIGGSDNDDIDQNSTNPQWSDSLDKDVGGKYSEGTYSKDSQIRVRGNITDEGSGVKTIYYAIFDKEIVIHGTSSVPLEFEDTNDNNTLKYGIKDAEALRDYIKSNNNGAFSPSGTVTKRVFYNVNPTNGHDLGGTKLSDQLNKNNCYTYYKDVETTYDHDFSGFVNSQNYIVIVAEDNIGNTAIDYAKVGTEDKYCASLNYDHIPPSISQAANSSGIQFINIETRNGNVVFKSGNDVAVAGSVYDADSKPKSITLDVNGHTITTKNSEYGKITTAISQDKTTISWSAEVYAKAFEGASGNIVITANATDEARNTASMPVTTVCMDTIDPVPVLTVSFDADENTTGYQVNKKINLNGTTTDNNTLPTNAVKKIQYSLKGNDWTAANATWTDYSDTSNEYSLTGNYSFAVTNFDTTKLTDGKTYALRVAAEDVAGNIGYSEPVEIKVAQDTDRPIVTLTNLSLASSGTSFLKSTTILEGTVWDDDGSITEISYSKTGAAPWTPLSLSGSSWKIPGLDEGANTVYFKITDTNGTTFTTAVAGAGATESTQPKIRDSKATPSYVANNNGSLALSFKVVTRKPDVSIEKFEVYNETTGWENRGTSLGTIGGIYTKFRITLKASSASFISGATATYEGTDYAFTCADQNHDDVDKHSWTSADINLGTENEVSIVVADASSVEDPMKAEQTIDFQIDNTIPTIRIKDPSLTVGVKETMQFDMSEAATSYYAVTRNTVTANAQTGAPSTEPIWTEILDTSNALARYVFFDDDLNETDHTARFALYLTETSTNPKYLGITTLAAIERTENPFEEITTVKFWVKAVDDCGNIGYASKEVNVDPQGNRPTVTLGYPVNVLKNGNYVAPTLGGTIRLDGNVSDDIGAKYVWIKIEREGNEFSGADVKFLNTQNTQNTKNYTIGDMTDNTVVDDDTIAALEDDAEVPNYAIRVPVTGTSWNLSINGNQEFNVANAEAHLKFKIYATDEDPDKVLSGVKHIHRSAEITQEIVIDSRTPYINTSELYLVKYNGNTEVARKEYKEGEDVDGIWYLQGTIKDDDSGLKTVSYKKNDAATYTEVITTSGGNVESIGGDTHFYFKKVAHSTNTSMFDYEFSVPLGSSAADQVGTDSIQIYAVENTIQVLHTEPIFKVTYDNKAPVFNTDSNNAFVKLSDDICNSSGFYTFGAIASEDAVTVGEDTVKQSGVERIAFYFTRDLGYGLNQLDPNVYTAHSGSTTNDLFDVMIYHSNVDEDDVNSGNMIVGYQSSLTYSDGLYWRSHTGSASGKTFTYTGDADPNIHAGGLVKINGVIYKIESVSGKTINLPSNIASATSAQFALCNVIDNSGEKNGSSTSSDHGYGFGYYGSRVSDDGDLITETFNNQGTDWIFDASINSKNLPDGPITLHMVAFDKAGNVTTTPVTMTGTVKNNAPRIAGLILGTDENGNGSVDDGEFVSAYSGKFTKGYDTAGNEMHDVTFPVVPDGGDQTTLLTVKGLTVVKPEIIGGNGAISYSYQVGTKDPVAGGALAKNGGSSVSGTTDDVVTGVITLPVSAFIGTTDAQDKGLIPDGTLSEFKFTFGDSTPGASLTDTTGKNNASITVFLDVALRETNKAKNWILPFYWNSATDNSLFNQSKDNGHIELATDWVTVDAYDADEAEYDADPKVSGKIKLEGIAKDDTLLREIKVKFGKSMGGLGTTDTTIATYNSNGTWTVTALESDGSINTTTGWASAVQQATYQDLLDVGIITTIPGDKEPTSKVPYTSQDYGHVVHWILYLDTEKVTGVANTDVTVTATATDRGKPTWSGNETTGSVVYAANTAETTGGTAISGAVTKDGPEISIAALTGYYRVDVVPYVTEVKRNSTYNTNKARSGAVSLLRGEATNLVKGFNLGTTTNTSIKIAANKAGTESAVAMTSVALSGTNLSFSVPTTAKTGYLHVVVNSIAALNNMNSYVDYNTETNAKAYDHNTLTDDRYVHIWRVSTADTFKGSKNANYPAMSSDSNGVLYASFTNYGQAKSYYSKAFVDASSVSYETSATATGDVTTVYYGYDPSEDTDISVGPDGKVNVFYNANFHGGSSDHWIGTGPANAGGIFVYDPDGTAINYNSNSNQRHNLYRFELYTYDDELNQFKNTRVNRTYVNGNAYVNIAYYDRLSNAIKYSFVPNEIETTTYYNTNVTFNWNAAGYYTSSAGNNYNYNFNNYYIENDGQYYKLVRQNNNRYDRYTITGFTGNSVTSKIYNRTNANDTSSNGLPWVTIDGEGDALDKNGTGFTFVGDWTPFKLATTSYSGVTQTTSTGESVALTSTAEGYPIVMYMDATTTQPRIAIANSVTPTSTSAWKVQGIFGSTDDNYDTASDYMSCMIDSQGYLHIAFQNTKGQLVYGKGTKNATTGLYDFGSSQVLDDSGMWIDMTMNGDTPYISYLSRVNSYDGMKIAFYDANFDENNDGTPDGGWETVTAAMNAKVTNVRTCIEPNARAADYATTNTKYTVAIGYHPGSDYRAAFYVGK